LNVNIIQVCSTLIESALNLPKKQSLIYVLILIYISYTIIFIIAINIVTLSFEINFQFIKIKE